MKSPLLKKMLVGIGLLAAPLPFMAQILTHEDSLAAGLQLKNNRATAISGYGEAYYAHDLNHHTATATLRRTVLFIGHRFTPKITFFSEMELENAKVSSGSVAGEISMEQAFLKFDVNRQVYISAGFLIPRMGILNENHLPTTFNGNERPVLETMLLPATWRELGACLYGSSRRMPGLNYSLGIFNGLHAQGFSLDAGIAGGRQEGFAASARQKAVTAALLYYYGGLRVQASSYVGGSVGLDNTTADYLRLQTGAFGSAVYLNEVNVQYRKQALTLKAIAMQVNIPQAGNINAAYANNTPEVMRGAYAEVAYDVLYKKTHEQQSLTDRQLLLFTRYEFVDMNTKMPENGIANAYFTQHHLFVGATFLPIRGVAIKADFHHILNGEFNKQLIFNPPPYALPFLTRRQFVNVGVCYSF